MIINDPRYRYTIVLWSVDPVYNIRWKLCPSEVDFSFSFIIKVHFPNWVRRNRRSMPTKSKLRRKRRRRPELNTRSPKRPFRGSWRTMRRWHLPPDTSKSSRDLSMKSFFCPGYIRYLWCHVVNMILQLGLVKGRLWFVHTITQFVALVAHDTHLLLNCVYQNIILRCLSHNTPKRIENSHYTLTPIPEQNQMKFLSVFIKPAVGKIVPLRNNVIC